FKDEPFDDDDVMLGTDGEIHKEMSPMVEKEGENMDTINIDLARKNEALKDEMAEMKKDHNDRMVKLITRASESQAKDRERIKELTLELTKLNEVSLRANKMQYLLG
ncbi:hypothetical protein PENTCL1PPCAC_24200, partial [Pristionchus entomophagus]